MGEWMPGMLMDVMPEHCEVTMSLEWLLNATKAARQTNSIANDKFPEVCKRVAEVFCAHKVWIAGSLVAPPKDDSERIRMLSQWLIEKLRRGPSQVQYLPARKFLLCNSK